MGFNIGAALGGALDVYEEKKARDDALLDKAWDEYTQDRRTARQKRESEREAAEQSIALLNQYGFNDLGVAASIARGGPLAVSHAIEEAKAYKRANPTGSLVELYTYTGPDYTGDMKNWTQEKWAEAVAGPVTTLDLGSYLGPAADATSILGGRSLRERFTDRAQEFGVGAGTTGQTAELGSVVFNDFERVASTFDDIAFEALHLKEMSRRNPNDLKLKERAERRFREARDYVLMKAGEYEGEQASEALKIVEGMDDGELRQQVKFGLGLIDGVSYDIETQMIDFEAGTGLKVISKLEDLGRGAGAILRDPIYANQPVDFEGKFKQALNTSILANQKNAFETHISAQVLALDEAVAAGDKAIEEYLKQDDSMFKTFVDFNKLGLDDELSLQKVQRALAAFAKKQGIRSGQGFQVTNAPEIMLAEGAFNVPSYVIFDGVTAFHQGMFKSGTYTRFGR